ncbi:MAG: hypothetical protein IT572_01900 [Deltaproteobacteria bacterium]|nr:hypothetical protein [Deltaproteobacteria bacterium]
MSRTVSLGQVARGAHRPAYFITKTKKRAKSSTEVSLNFPKNWVEPLSPLAYEMEARALAWLRERGVIHDAAGEEKFEKLAVAEYANWPFPTAAAEQAEVLTKFLALWIFYDDIIEEADDGQQERIYEAIAGRPETRPEGNSHLGCWWELGRAYARRMSPDWLERHARRFADWVRSVREESRAAAQFRKSGLYPSAAKHLERRALNIGMMPNIDFIEYQSGRELPESLLCDADMRQLAYLAAEVVAIINDIFGYAKDRRLNWCNLVSCLAQEFQISLEESFRWVADMHNARVRAIGLLEEKLLQKSYDRELLQGWLQGLRHVMYGFARWHAMAPRYSAVHEVGDSRLLRIRIRDF